MRYRTVTKILKTLIHFIFTQFWNQRQWVMAVKSKFCQILVISIKSFLYPCRKLVCTKWLLLLAIAWSDLVICVSFTNVTFYWPQLTIYPYWTITRLLQWVLLSPIILIFAPVSVNLLNKWVAVGRRVGRARRTAAEQALHSIQT